MKSNLNNLGLVLASLTLVSCSTGTSTRKQVGVVAPPMPPLSHTMEASSTLVAPPPPQPKPGSLQWDIIEGKEQWRMFNIYTSTNPAGPFNFLEQVYIEYPTNTTIIYPVWMTNKQHFYYVDAVNILTGDVTNVTTKK
jgi:hypothetical protein